MLPDGLEEEGGADESLLVADCEEEILALWLGSEVAEEEAEAAEATDSVSLGAAEEVNEGAASAA